MLHINFFESGRSYGRGEALNEISLPGYLPSYQRRTSLAQSRTKFSKKVEQRSLTQDVFDNLVAEWVDAVQFSSSLDEVVEDPTYLRIIGYGWSAVPFLLEDLRNDPKPWFVALRKITGENPIRRDQAGDFKSMIAAWLDWAEISGY